MLKKWEKISERTIIKNDHWSYNVDNFIIDKKFKGEYHYVHTLGSSMVIPLSPENKILLTKQFRYLNNKESWEFPCGAVEEGLTIEENAIKELREESGYTTSKLIKIGEFSPYTGAADEICTLFLASNLIHSPLPKDETEDFETDFFSKKEIQDMIDGNIIWDGLTLAAWSLIINKI
ncbi:MAG: NUDIX hydrolase [bacterium]